MIHVDRSSVPEPPVLLRDRRKGKLEKTRVIQVADELLDAPAARLKEHKFKFGAYKHSEVSDALSQLFRNKCAYCEQRYAGTQPMDIEHWRPKGKVFRDGKEDMKPGYYWLAAEWSNLLPSCIDCNRARKQKVPPDNREVLLGKSNQFPIALEDHRCINHRMNIYDEIPLLLDPCKDRPEEYLEFNLDGFVRPKSLRAEGEPSDAEMRDESTLGRKRAESSINVYALNRAGLVYERLEMLRLIEQRKFSITQLMRILADIETSSGKMEDLAHLVEILLDHELQALRAFMEPSRRFCQMARQIINQFFVSLDSSESAVAVPD